MMPAPNRVAHLLDELPAPPRPRTPAQQQASRHNGSKSHGPRTIAGKSRSRLNGLHHGLLARVVAPPSDPRGDDQLYLQIRQRLFEQFNPRLFTDTLTIDVLAGEIIELGRIRKMVESVYRPAPMAPHDAQLWDRMRACRSDIGLLQAVQVNLDAGHAQPCDGRQAGRAADLVADLVAQVLADLADADGEDGPADAQDQSELTQLRDLTQLLGPATRRFQDHAWLTAVLTGERRLRPADRRRLTSLLDRLVTSMASWLDGHADQEQRLQRQCEQNLAVLAQDPRRLILLRRYASRVEHSIARKLRTLRPD